MNDTNTVVPQNGARYSALRHLQEKVAARCAALPWTFESLQAWNAYRERLVCGLRTILPVWDLTDARPSPVVAELALGADLTLEAVDVHFEAGFCIPVHLYRPRAKAGPRAAVLVCPGYSSPKNAPEIADLCIALARAGMIAVTLDYDGTGERAERPDSATAINNVCAAAALLGMNNVGLRVMNNLAVLKYLKTRADVDAARIGITGHCQGSIVTWFTAAVCAEFAAVAPVQGVTSYEAIILEYCNRQGGWSGISPYVYGMLEYGDIPHVLACTAPRPLWVRNNIVDPHWPYSGLARAKALCEQIYALHGAGDRCTFHLGHEPHQYAPAVINDLVPWFARMLGAA
ncbi:MAG: hypothetical protein A3K19_24705 [Lentisphaerae bacterium RIFOXYB12_FULL_65_16]|nr:MAG: hypothetical protein A3K18_24120 [Lentisphaerae bacterium RIFOXYA12_64_32]OGV90672.1 MAG: hypothetical protein A3K19_24705 [Lentisphaerae bacterium RIFOXYB12_FULL_65_16]